MKSRKLKFKFQRKQLFLRNMFFKIQSNLYKMDILDAKKTVRLIQVSVLSRFPNFCMFSGQLKGPQSYRHYFLIYGTSDYYPSIIEPRQDVKNRRNSFWDMNIQIRIQVRSLARILCELQSYRNKNEQGLVQDWRYRLK